MKYKINLPKKLLEGRTFTLGDRKPTKKEKTLKSIKFNIYKFNSRPRPSDNKRIIIISNFSEFGCESIGLLYSIPAILKQYSGAYFIVVGWYGREYLYRHLVDEYWEVKEEYQWLREYAYAFHHNSNNLKILEKQLLNYGQVYQSRSFGGQCLNNVCRSCKNVWNDINYNKNCPKCNSDNLQRSLFSDTKNYKKTALQVPKPSESVMELADKFVKNKRTVGIFARGRKCYGRNLPPKFYKKLIKALRYMDYDVIWLGEKQSVIPCPVSDVIDFSRMEESKNLELLLAIVSKLCFTIQFWTASTRFASMTGTPWILFESPDQICGRGQEGMRIDLTTDDDKKKIVLAHYLNVANDFDLAIETVKRSIFEINNGNWETIVGMVDNEEIIQGMLKK